MREKVAWVTGWELRPRPDGGFGVYDLHGLIAGPVWHAGGGVRGRDEAAQTGTIHVPCASVWIVELV